MIDCQNLSASQSVIINDTVISSGKTYFIPVLGSIQFTNESEIKLVLKYNSYLLNIKSVHGDPNYTIGCETPVLNNNFNDLANAELEIICSDSIHNTNNGIICMLEVEALRYQDSIAFTQPIQLYLNSQLMTEISFRPGNIIVRGELIYDKIKEGLGINFPNPFDVYSYFNFSLDKATTVQFSVYSYLGRNVEYTNINKQNISIYQSTKTGYIEISDIESTLERGIYVLEFHPNNWEFSSGLYFLVLKTRNGIYNTNFIIHK